jgi:hypothetical protein
MADFGGLAEVVAIVCTMERAPGDRREAEIRTAGLVGCGKLLRVGGKASISSMKTRILEEVKLLTTKRSHKPSSAVISKLFISG